jgi:tripartite-type tricarboxylate transporter receptor subunit TctC
MTVIHSRLLRIAVTLIALSAATAAMAQGVFPTKPVRLIVPYSPGGGTDILARNVAQKLSELWGQSVIVENKPGANGVIGTEQVVKSAPDGHTLVVVTPTHAINPYLYKQLPYDTRKDLAPVTNLAISPFVLVISAQSQWKGVSDIVAEAKANPGKLGIGYSEGTTQLTSELFKQSAGIDLITVAYKGGALIMTDLIGGHLAMGFTSVVTALPHVRSGKLRVVGIAGPKRVAVFPDAQTFSEAALRGVESAAWYAVFAPAKTPPDVIRRVQGDIARVLAQPDMQEKVASVGAEPVGNTPEELGRYLDQQLELWGRVAKAAGIKPE